MTKPGNVDAAITKRITKQGLQSLSELRGELIKIECLRVTFACSFEPLQRMTDVNWTFKKQRAGRSFQI